MALKKFPGSPYTYGAVLSDNVLNEWAQQAMDSIAQAEHWAAEFDESKAYLERTPEFLKATIPARRKMYSENWDMSDAASKYNFHRERANMYHAAITAQRALRGR